MKIHFYVENKSVDEDSDKVIGKDEKFFAYDVYNDGSIYISQEDDFGWIWKKNLDEVIDELCSVRDEMNRLKEEYGIEEFLKLMDENYHYDVPIHDYQKVVTWQERVKPRNG